MSFEKGPGMFYIRNCKTLGESAVNMLRSGRFPDDAVFRMYSDEDVRESFEDGWLTKIDFDFWLEHRAAWEKNRL